MSTAAADSPGHGADDRSVSKVDLFSQAAARAGSYISQERVGRVFPSRESLQALNALTDWSLAHPLPAEEVVDRLADIGAASAVRSTGGRYFGFVTGGTEPTALAASLLSLAWDQNGALPAMSPMVSTIDTLAARWIVELLGLPTQAVASFCGGASVANLIAVVAARDSLLAARGWSVAESGLRGAPTVHVITSRESHSSVGKALRIAGWGSAEIHQVDTDELGRLRVDDMPNVTGPVVIVAQMGNVNTGHCDPINEIADWADARFSAGNYWIHIDGAFGLWAAASPRQRHHAVGVDRAHSWATDAHKWLNTPYDCGVVIARDGMDLRRAMSATAAYLPGDSATADAGWSDELREPMHLGLQMSQAARSIPVFAELAVLGSNGVAELVDRCCRHAERLASLLAEGGVDIPAPPGLNQTLARFDSDTTTDAVVNAIQDGGRCWAGATTWNGRRAMRLSVCDVSTTADDIETSAQAILAAWDSVTG